MNATVLLSSENAIGCGTGTGMPAPQSALKSTSAAQLSPKLSPLSGQFNLLKQHYF
ncbi:hypothetical protein QUB63_09495 [Microcoleus sp. ARI1-B5]|uniref:hypothetical protein n=1 Tax=unclassified Microcoleus TaxID=2642155 RepID=UPI002FD5661A